MSSRSFKDCLLMDYVFCRPLLDKLLSNAAITASSNDYIPVTKSKSNNGNQPTKIQTSARLLRVKR
jgi:hypothetical protein